VVERALGEGRLARTRALGQGLPVEALYGPDGLIRPHLLVLRRPGATPAPIAEEAPPGDAEVALAGGPAPEDTEIEEIPYALQDGKVTRVARIERTGGDATLVFTDLHGQEQRAAIRQIRDGRPGVPPPGYRVARKPSGLASIVTYILLYACGKWKKSRGTEILWELAGKSFLGKYAVHNDGPGGPRPTDHPGIDLYEEAPPPLRRGPPRSKPTPLPPAAPTWP
jgi:hypothetical protein